MLIKFSKQDIEKCEKFAKSIDTDYYASRKQFNNEKRIKDQCVGKLGEIATFKYFQLKEIDVSEPDFKIYDKKKKSWDYDLKGKNLNLHVKTQNVEQGKKYGISWIFEKSDKHVFTEYSKNDYVCFVAVDLVAKTATIKSVIALETLHKLALFKKPKLDYLTTKAAVYYNDIQILKSKF